MRTLMASMLTPIWRRPDSTRAGVIGSETLALATSKAGVYLARQLARDGEKQLALEVLGDLVTGGFFCSTALQNDPWLRPLAGIPRYGVVLDAVLRREGEARAAFEAAGGDQVLSP